jgi:hypothetical protein
MFAQQRATEADRALQWIAASALLCSQQMIEYQGSSFSGLLMRVETRHKSVSTTTPDVENNCKVAG